MATVLLAGAWLIAAPGLGGEARWPQWRGPLGNGLSPDGAPPLTWSETHNVRWKVELPGTGSSTPVVWDERIYLTAAVPVGDAATPGQAQQLVVLAIDRSTGETVWQTVVRETVPHEGTHPLGNYAAPSAITDGERVWAFFGSHGLYALSAGDGSVIWEKDLGDMKIRREFGEGASPVLYDDRLLVPWDHEGDSFFFALDKTSGEELWRTERDEVTSWATPLVVELEGGPQVVVSATGRVRGYDVDTGRPLWEAEGMTVNTIPAPVAADGMVYVTSGFRGSGLLAIRLAGARGDLTGTDAIVWQRDRDTPYVPSPIVHDGVLYFLKVNSNILTAVDAATGEEIYQQRVEGLGDVFSSPVVADGRIYITSREGTTVVLRAGRELEVLATNQLDDGFDASMAVVGGEIYLRSSDHLYRISE